jgi:ferrous iron transport protein B
MKRVALVGSPNAGKTTVFNALCGARQHTGNYAGVTVEKKTGRLVASDQIEILDLPGTYSLNAQSADEAIAAEIILGSATGEPKPDLLLVTLDASNLKRSLYLASQAAEGGSPMCGVLTMQDVARRRGIEVDVIKLEKQLGFKVVEVTRANSKEISNLTSQIVQAVLKPERKPVRAKLKKTPSTIDERYRQIDTILRHATTRTEPKSRLTQVVDSVLTHRFYGFFIFIFVVGIVFYSIYAGAEPLMRGIEDALKFVGTHAQNLVAGYPITASLIGDGIFAGVGSVLVFIPQIAILFFFIALLEESGYLARTAYLMDRLLGWTGLNGRAFIPLLSSFACAIPGIMAARVMPSDRARAATILIAPLMSCSARLRVYVLFVSAFIQPRYGAMWATVALFGMHMIGVVVALPLAWLLNRKILRTAPSPFILELPEYRMPHWRNVARRVWDAVWGFLMRVGTIIFAISILIWALAYFPHSKVSERAAIADYASEHQLGANARKRLLNEGPTSLDSTRATELNTAIRGRYLKDSLLGRFGTAIEPVFRPLGFDWKMSVAIVAAFPAREVFVTTLGIIFSIDDEEDSDKADKRLAAKLIEARTPQGKPVYDVLTAISAMIFFALCAQCMSTLAAIRRELASTGWAVAVFFTMTGLAYIIAFAVYQTGRLFMPA